MFNADGTFSYTPLANFNGADSFTYRAFDGSLLSGAVTVSLTVNAVNDAPVALDDAFNGAEDNVVVGNVLANDSDVEGTQLAAALVAGPAHGTLALNADGSFTYTPAANYFGSDTFTYRATDGAVQSAIATVTLAIASVNDAPLATDDEFTGPRNIPVIGNVLTNDTDVEGDALVASIVGNPGNGILALGPDGSFTYTPNAGFAGVDVFSYRASDSLAFSNIATVSITVTGEGAAAPVAVVDAFSGDEDTSIAGNVLGNDTDANGDTLTAALVAGPANGVLSLNTNGGFTYTPGANFFGTDSFTYQASDGGLQSAVTTVTLTVNPVNDAPVAGDDSITTLHDKAVVLTVTQALANDVDAEGDALDDLGLLGCVARHRVFRWHDLHLHTDRRLCR